MSHPFPRPRPIAPLVAALLAVTISQLPGAASTHGQIAKYEVMLKFEKISGAHGGPDSCPGAKRDGSDVMTGIVEGNESAGGDSIRYEGVLSRTTRLEYCENWRPKGEDEFCVPILIGKQARVRTTIITYAASTNQDADIKYAPLVSSTDSVDVKGACTSEMELGIVKEYLAPEGFTIDTANQAPLARLAKGLWQDVKPRPVTGPDGWTLTVVRKTQ